MANGDEFIIVGAGLAGLSVAYELLQRGHPVRVVEARENVALETSFANGGLLTPAMSDPWNAPGVHRDLISSLAGRHSAVKLRFSAIPSLVGWGVGFLKNSRAGPHRVATVATYRLADYSLRLTRALRDGSGLQFDGAARGTLKIFRSQEALDASLAAANLLKNEGLNVEVLDRDGAVAVEPQLQPIREELVGALYNPDDECGDAYLFCHALADRIEAAGGAIVRGCRVESLAVENGHIVGVRGPRGLVSGRGVVLAAGNMSARLARRLGVKLSIRPAKGYSLTFNVDPALLPRLPVIDDTMHAAATPLGNRLRMAGTAEFAGDDTSISPDRIANLVNVLASIFPQLASAPELESAKAWAGLRPMSSDGLPYIGAARLPGLWINTGHGHLGWTLATGSARLLADLIEGRQTEIDQRPYRVER